jgi:hypothetical protein
MKTFLYKIYAIFGMPALTVHEVLHILALLGTFTKIKGFEFYWKDTIFHFTIKKKVSRNFLTEITISFAPLLAYIIFAILSFYSIIAVCIFIYLLLFFRAGLPSRNDVANVFFYKKRSKINEEYKLLYGEA